MSQPGDADLLVKARSVLLDALAALDEHLDSLVVIGAQAVYLHTGSVNLPVAETTKDSDIAIDPRSLSSDPLIDAAMKRAGFYQDLGGQPGSWLSADEIPVDLMVPETLAGGGSRRSGQIPPHGKHATRRAVGLEAAVVDSSQMDIASLDPTDTRSIPVRVAGPAALMVSKLYKIYERKEQPGRLVAKDAHDIYRLLVATDIQMLAAKLRELSEDDLAGGVTRDAISYLRVLFASPTALGSIMVGTAEELAGDPEFATAAVTALASDLLNAIDS